MRKVSVTATLVAAITAFYPVAVSAHNLKEWLERPVQATFQTEKPLEEIEHCVALEISDKLMVGSFRGPQKVEVYGFPIANFSNVIHIVVTIDDIGEFRKISLRATKGTNDKGESWIRSCIN